MENPFFLERVWIWHETCQPQTKFHLGRDLKRVMCGIDRKTIWRVRFCRDFRPVFHRSMFTFVFYFHPSQWKSFFILFVWFLKHGYIESSLFFGPSKGLSKIWSNPFPAAVAQPPLFMMVEEKVIHQDFHSNGVEECCGNWPRIQPSPFLTFFYKDIPTHENCSSFSHMFFLAPLFCP